MTEPELKDSDSNILEASSQRQRLSIHQGDDGQTRVAKVQAFLTSLGEGPLAGEDVKTVLEAWSQSQGSLLHTLAAHEIHRLFLRHFTARLMVVADPRSIRLTEANLQDMYRMADEHLSSFSNASSDGDTALKVSQASLSAAALKLLHALLALPRSGPPSPCLVLSAAEIEYCVQSLLLASNYRPNANPATTRSAPSPFASRSSLRQSVASESEVTSTDYGSDNRSQAGTYTDNPQKRVKSTARTVRQNAISCLSALHEAFPALLFSSWPKLLQVEEVNLGVASTSALPMGGFARMAAAPGRPTRSLLTVIQDDPVLSVRLAACQLVMNMFKKAAQKGFLTAGIVEPRATGVRPSFTSLSARMGSLIANVRSLLAHLLDCGGVDTRKPLALEREAARRMTASAPIPAPLTECLLRCTKSLVMVTSTAKLRRSHADVLRDPVIRLSSHSDPSVAIAAFNLLSTLNPTAALPSNDTPASSLPKADTSAVEGLLGKLGDDSLEADVLVKAWSALANFAQGDRGSIASRQGTLLQHVLRHLKKDDQAVRQACVAFTAVEICGDDADVVEYAKEYIEIVQMATCDDSSLVRTEVSQVIPGAVRLEMAFTGDCPISLTSLKMIQALDVLVKDSEAVTRAAAIRAVGVLLASAAQGSSDSKATNTRTAGQGGRLLPTSQLIPHAMKLLEISQDAEDDNATGQSSSTPSPLLDGALLVRLRASWALANLAQAVGCDGGNVSGNVMYALMKATLPLLSDDERVVVNGLRCAGLLLASASLDEQQQSTRTVAKQLTLQLIEWTKSAKSPKTKWNAVNAISTALSSDGFRVWLSSSSENQDEEEGDSPSLLFSVLTRTLASQLLSKVFKVKLAAVSGLMRVLDSHVAPADVSHLRHSLTTALSTIEEEITEATFREAQLHGESTRNALIQLQARLDAIEVA